MNIETKITTTQLIIATKITKKNSPHNECCYYKKNKPIKTETLLISFKNHIEHHHLNSGLLEFNKKNHIYILGEEFDNYLVDEF